MFPRPPLFFLFLVISSSNVRTFTLNCQVGPGARHAAAGRVERRLGCCLTCITSRLMFWAFVPYLLQPSKPAMAVPLSWVGGSCPRWRPPRTARPRFKESWWERGGNLAARKRHLVQKSHGASTYDVHTRYLFHGETYRAYPAVQRTGDCYLPGDPVSCSRPT